MNPIKLDTGYISGTVGGHPGQEVSIYRGIPYAAPPMGDLRWKPPQPAAHGQVFANVLNSVFSRPSIRMCMRPMK